ncbi:hypothetical protein EHS13_22980 [Paenibacillus psychroresistens]|uniref:MvaI/BcnI restriction endonuclease domain-containing protein n=1 Tax=Paenibacillus psychroresistens TaxID=1778678 RepID=A0A6B8RNX5_9BACL|nr:MvaI/BcnI family restriction endonuclease [Paenibacillus psychroresistens]QGQ97547.1 hypothetical protein EHS13_22980 [Paenibacillus psychroresistens]
MNINDLTNLFLEFNKHGEMLHNNQNLISKSFESFLVENSMISILSTNFGNVNISANNNNLMTMFSLEPKKNITWFDFINLYGHADYRGRPSFSATITNFKNTSNGLFFEIEDDKLVIFKNNNSINEKIAHFNILDIINKFSDKYRNRMILALYNINKVDKTVLFSEVYQFANFSKTNLIQCINSGLITIDIQANLAPNGSVHTHGTLFRIRKKSFKFMFEEVKRIL